ncbi:hypothetical protein D046_3575A, partial [Vibrio parahaemolyticus V-223/04]
MLDVWVLGIPRVTS